MANMTHHLYTSTSSCENSLDFGFEAMCLPTEFANFKQIRKLKADSEFDLGILVVSQFQL